MFVIRDASALALFHEAALLNMNSVQSMSCSPNNSRDNRALLRSLGGGIRILNQLSAQAPLIEEDPEVAAMATAKPLPCSTVAIPLDDGHKEEQECFYMCHHALTFATHDGVLSQHSLAMAVAIMIYNTALAYHLYGATRYTKNRALQLYRHVLNTAGEISRVVVQQDKMIVLKSLQVLAMNNSTHILLCHKEMDKAVQGLKQLQPLVRSLQGQFQQQHDDDDSSSHMTKFVLGTEVLDELAMNVFIPAITQTAEAA